MTNDKRKLKERLWRIVYYLPGDRIQLTLVRRKIISRYVWAHAPEHFIKFDYEAIDNEENN